MANRGGPDSILTLRFFRSEPGRYAAVEEYADDEASLAHQDNAHDLLKRVAGCAEEVSMDPHGLVGPVIRGRALGEPGATLYDDLSAG